MLPLSVEEEEIADDIESLLLKELDLVFNFDFDLDRSDLLDLTDKFSVLELEKASSFNMTSNKSELM